MAKIRSIEERFFKKIDKTKTCWLWTAALNTGGYGVIGTKGTHIIGAHRLSFIIHHGNIPKGLHVLHKCNVRNCVNPNHLYAGTNKDNVIDKCISGSAAKKLNESNVKAIRTMKSGIAIKMFGISEKTVSNIKGRRTWRHIL